MTQAEIKAQIRSLEAQLRKAQVQLVQVQQAEAQAACERGEQVVAYIMNTGIRYVCGAQAYMVTDRNTYGEHKIKKGKTVVVTTRNPVKELTQLFGVSAYGAIQIDARKA